MIAGRNELMALVQVYIHTHLHEPALSLGFLADRFQFSRSWLTREYKAFTGTSIGNYIVEARMEKAKKLLGSGALSIAEVADIVGYSGPSYFSYVYTKYFGYPPSRII